MHRCQYNYQTCQHVNSKKWHSISRTLRYFVFGEDECHHYFESFIATLRILQEQSNHVDIVARQKTKKVPIWYAILLLLLLLLISLYE